MDPDGREVKNKYYSSVKDFFSFLGVKQSEQYYKVENMINGLRSTKEGERLYNKLHSSKTVFEISFKALKDRPNGKTWGLFFPTVRGMAYIHFDYEKVIRNLSSGYLSPEEWFNLDEALIQMLGHEFKHGEQFLDKSQKNESEKEKEAEETRKDIRSQRESNWRNYDPQYQ